jgi:hypothetical protein
VGRVELLDEGAQLLLSNLIQIVDRLGQELCWPWRKARLALSFLKTPPDGNQPFMHFRAESSGELPPGTLLGCYQATAGALQLLCPG